MTDTVRRRPGRDETRWPMPVFGPWPDREDHHHVAVIGAGIGGLAAAALLAARGLKVAVFESHDRPGGFCSSWRRKVKGPNGSLTFTFDAGVQDFSGLGARGPLRNLLRQLDLETALEWRRVRHRYWRDGISVTIPDEPLELQTRLADLFPEEREGIFAFFHEIGAIYRELYEDIEKTGGVPMAPTSIGDLLAWPGRHPHAWRWLKQPFSAMLDRFLKDHRLKGLLTTLSDYITDKPERLLVQDMAPLYGYYFDGGAYPVGGSQKLAEALRDSIHGHGGQVRLKARVDSILVDQGRVTGVGLANGERHAAPLALANGDVVAMLTDLLPAEHLPSAYGDRVRAIRRGPSAILLSLGLDTLPAQPARMFVHEDGLEFGIGNPSVIDPSLAPPGHAALTILCLLSEDEAATWRRGDPDYPARKAAFAERLIEITERTVIPGLSRHIIHREVASPATFTRYAHTRNGNIYGAARAQWFPPIPTPVPGLMLVGAGTPTGAGIEAVVMSGTIAANLAAPPGAQDARADRDRRSGGP